MLNNKIKKKYQYKLGDEIKKNKNRGFKINLILIFIVLKPGPARRVYSGLELDRVEEKTGKGKTWCDLADPAG
jgi:hypothetical protein